MSSDSDAISIVSLRFVGADLFVYFGSQAINLLSATASHPEFPIFAVALGTIPALANGLTVNLCGDAEPLSITVFNVNYSQTRTIL